MINQSSQLNNDIYISVSELCIMLNQPKSTLTRRLDSYIYRTTTCRGGKRYEILISSLEPDVQEKIKLLKPELFILMTKVTFLGVLLALIIPPFLLKKVLTLKKQRNLHLQKPI